MTKFSDLLRAAIDRAPVSNSPISAEEIRKRINRRKIWWTAANGTLAICVAALVVFGLQYPLRYAANDAVGELYYPADIADSQSADRAGSERLESFALYDGSVSLCGTQIWEQLQPAASGTFLHGYVDLEDHQGRYLAAPSEFIFVSSEIFVNEGGTLAFNSPRAYLLWNGTVVAEQTVTGSSSDQTIITEMPPGSVWGNEPLEFPLFNCFDGTELPPGDYELVVTQQVQQVATTATTDDLIAVQQELENLRQKLEFEPESISSQEQIAVLENALTAFNSTGELELNDWDRSVDVVAETMRISILGAPPRNPFGHYLNQITDVTSEVPLSPAVVRQHFANATASKWTMQPNTSRALMTSDSNKLGYTAAQPIGCANPIGKRLGEELSETGRELPWLEYGVSLPAKVDLEYGWVVAGNPVVTVEVRNLTQDHIRWESDAFAPRLLFLQHGTVLAEASLTPTHNPAATVIPVEHEAEIAPEAVVNTTYLLRDLSTCANYSTSTSNLPNGTYTVVLVDLVPIREHISAADSSNTAALDELMLEVFTAAGTVTVANVP